MKNIGSIVVLENLNTGNKINMSPAALLKFIKLTPYSNHSYTIRGVSVWHTLYDGGYIL